MTTNCVDAAVGLAVKALGARHGATLAQAAMEAGLDRFALADVMSGDRRLGAAEMFVIASILDVELAEFFRHVPSTCGE